VLGELILFAFDRLLNEGLGFFVPNAVAAVVAHLGRHIEPAEDISLVRRLMKRYRLGTLEEPTAVAKRASFVLFAIRHDAAAALPLS
jgi:hypothetical protein